MLVGLSTAEGKERPQSMQRKRYVAEASKLLQELLQQVATGTTLQL